MRGRSVLVSSNLAEFFPTACETSRESRAVRLPGGTRSGTALAPYEFVELQIAVKTAPGAVSGASSVGDDGRRAPDAVAGAAGCGRWRADAVRCRRFQAHPRRRGRRGRHACRARTRFSCRQRSRSTRPRIRRSRRRCRRICASISLPVWWGTPPRYRSAANMTSTRSAGWRQQSLSRRIPRSVSRR